MLLVQKEPLSWEWTPYTVFKAKIASFTPLVFFGSNNGVYMIFLKNKEAIVQFHLSMAEKDVKAIVCS